MLLRRWVAVSRYINLYYSSFMIYATESIFKRLINFISSRTFHLIQLHMRWSMSASSFLVICHCIIASLFGPNCTSLYLIKIPIASKLKVAEAQGNPFSSRLAPAPVKGEGDGELSGFVEELVLFGGWRVPPVPLRFTSIPPTGWQSLFASADSPAVARQCIEGYSLSPAACMRFPGSERLTCDIRRITSRSLTNLKLEHLLI